MSFHSTYLPLLLFIACPLFGAFHPETKICIGSELRSIGTLHAGEQVLSKESGESVLRTIAFASTPQKTTGIIFLIENQIVKCSEDQLFWTRRGWTKASLLQCGDELLSGDSRWWPLLSNPHHAPIDTISICLMPNDLEDIADEHLFLVSPLNLLCHNDAILVPLIMLSLSTGEVITITASAFMHAVATFGAWWLGSELEQRLNRLGFPDEHTLENDPQWINYVAQLSEVPDIHIFESDQLQSALFFNSDSIAHQEPNISPEEFCWDFKPLIIDWEQLPSDQRERLWRQIKMKNPSLSNASLDQKI